MTYTTVSRRYGQRRKPPRPSGLSGFLEDIAASWGITPPPTEESQCLATANAATAPFDAKIDDLARTWNPTGFYTSAEVRTLVSATMQVVARGYDALTQAASEPSASSDSITRATDDLARAGQRSLDYLQAASAADQQGIATLNAPGLKRWVTDSMAAASSAIVTASVIGCLRPWWVTALAAFQVAFDALYDVARRLVGAVLKIGDFALKVPDALDDMLTVLKWGLGLGGAAWLLWEVSKAKNAGRSIL